MKNTDRIKNENFQRKVQLRDGERINAIGQGTWHMGEKHSERAKEIWEYIAPRYGIVLEEWNHDIDHVHVMFRAQPKTELSKFINAYKSASSRLLKLLSAPCRRGAA